MKNDTPARPEGEGAPHPDAFEAGRAATAGERREPYDLGDGLTIGLEGEWVVLRRHGNVVARDLVTDAMAAFAADSDR